ncbi:MAG: hypothetical protein JW882_15135, partial [Deltaproteobacteria bacterium]|nr:hypothetical protein [Deltaproteobacteria bacterium]
MTEDPAKDGVNWYVYCANNPLRFVDPSGLYVVYTPSGRTEYFTRDDPVRQKMLDSQYKFSPTTNSCKTAAIINSYLADGKTVISDKQLDQIILNQDGSIKASVKSDGSPGNGDIISQDTARALGLTEYNKLEKSSDNIDSSDPAIVQMYSSEYRSTHYVYKDSKGTIDSLPSNRVEASTYADQRQNTITKTLLPEEQTKREEEQRQREEFERRNEQSRRAEESRRLEEARKQVDAMKEETQNEGTQSETETSPKIICAELYRQGMMDEDIYRVDEQFGIWLKQYMPLVLDGYHAWAKPIVREMRKSEKFTATVQRIAEPWTYEMAYLMGEREQGNLIGALEMFIGI